MKIHHISGIVMLCLGLCLSVVSCNTYDYDAELNDAEQQRIRLHQEDQKIYDEITEAAYSLDHLIGEMSNRVRGELSEKEQNLLQAITESESLVDQYLTKKLGDADGYLDFLESQSRQLFQDKEGTFNQACATLQTEMIALADAGYTTNAAQMQEGIDLLNNFQSQYDNAIGKMRERIQALQQMQQRLSALETLITQNQAKRNQLMQRVSQLQTKMQQSIQAAITSTKTSEEHTAALQNLQSQYSALVIAMKQLEQTYDYDNSWVNEAENYVQTVEQAIIDIQTAISQTNELNTLLEQFEAGKAEDMLATLEEIRDNMETLTNYDTSLLDDAQDTVDEVEKACNDIYDAIDTCEEACQRAEDAYNDCDWESWKS